MLTSISKFDKMILSLLLGLPKDLVPTANPGFLSLARNLPRNDRQWQYITVVSCAGFLRIHDSNYFSITERIEH